MARFRRMVLPLAALCLAVGHAAAQDTLATQLGNLMSLRDKVGDADTRVRVDALHRVWRIALNSPHSDVKVTAIDLLKEPLGSASDHIRMPAAYAIAEIANSTDDQNVKLRALTALNEPLNASQVPIRDVAIDVANSITRSARAGDLALAAVTALGPPVRSGNNGVRIPAINALVRAVEGSQSEAAYRAALDLLVAPLDSGSLIGGLEVRMMALLAVEHIGLDASDVATKAKAVGLAQSYASRGGWEPEANRRAQEAAAAIQASIKPR